MQVPPAGDPIPGQPHDQAVQDADPHGQGVDGQVEQGQDEQPDPKGEQDGANDPGEALQDIDAQVLAQRWGGPAKDEVVETDGEEHDRPDRIADKFQEGREQAQQARQHQDEHVQAEQTTGGKQIS